jgi:hypothetical protein
MVPKNGFFDVTRHRDPVEAYGCPLLLIGHLVLSVAMSNGVRWEIYMNIKIEMQVGKDKTF